MPINKVQILTSDGREYTVDYKIARKLLTVKTMLEDLGWDESNQHELIPLPEVHSTTLEKVLIWAKKHKDDEDRLENEQGDADSIEIPVWDKEFLSMLDKATLFEVIIAANHLEVKRLLDYSCKYLSSLIKSKTAEEIRETFNIKGDFTPAEEEQIRRENQWCEEK